MSGTRIGRGGGHMGRTMSAAAWALADFLWQLDGQGTFVEEALIEEVCVCGRFFMESYVALHDAAWARAGAMVHEAQVSRAPPHHLHA